MTVINDINDIYDVWFLIYGMQWTECFAILDHFLPFQLPKNPKNQNLEKNKKAPGDMILHKCTKNYDQMMYRSCDMVRNRWADRRTEKVTYRGGYPT